MSWPSIILFGLKINVFSIPPFIISVLTLSLGLFVYLKNKKEIQNVVYLFLCISIFLWLFFASIVFSRQSNDNMTTFLAKMIFIGVTFIPVTFFHFVISFLKIRNQTNVVKVAYLTGVGLVTFLFFTNFYISGISKMFWGYYPKAGILHFFDILLFFSLYGYSLWLLYKKWKTGGVDIQQKIKMKYAFAAFFIASFAAIDYIPNYGYQMYPFGYIFIFAMVSIFAYAILRHRLFDIEVIIKKTLIFGGLFAIAYAIFAFFAFLGQMFFERFVTHNRWISMIPSVLVVTIMLRPLENFLVAITDKYLFQKKYDYKNLIRTFTSEVLTVLELDKLIQLTEDRLMDIMKLKSCKFVEIASAASRPRNDDVLKLPISVKGEALGTLLLGKKKSDEDYTQEDIDILQPLTRTLGIAISNAKLFEELVKTRAEMAQKDKMATIGTLAAGMAHEIRNPITTIRNFADYLPEKCGDNAFMGKFERLIPREIDRIESIARSLLEFSSAKDAESMEEFAIDEPMKAVIGLLEPRYRTSEISILCDYKEKHIVKGSKIQLQDAFFNIMNYILAETQKGGKIFMECAVNEEKLSLSIRTKDLVVADHIIKDVFEPVSGLYKERRGFGFNLFIAKELIERSGATLEITSDKIKGSEFRIDFKNASEQP